MSLTFKLSLTRLCLFSDCEDPFVYSPCGAPCEKQCALQGNRELCLGVTECAPGCYCPEVITDYTLYIPTYSSDVHRQAQNLLPSHILCSFFYI